MKNILCILGLHKPAKFCYLSVTRYHMNGKKYRRNYAICDRCNKRLLPLGELYKKRSKK